MANNELLIANLDLLGTTSLQVYLQSTDGIQKTPPVEIGPQSFVEINTSPVGKPPWTLWVNNVVQSKRIDHLPAVVSISFNILTAILYPSTASK
jgi:hypothetical protein